MVTDGLEPGASPFVKKSPREVLERSIATGAPARPLSPVRVHAAPLAAAAMVVLGTAAAAIFATRSPPPPFAPVNEMDDTLLFEPLPTLSAVRPAPIVPERIPPRPGGRPAFHPTYGFPPPTPTATGPVAVFGKGEGARQR